jgi:hypothetical protein
MEASMERYYYPLFLAEFPNCNERKMNEPVLLTVRCRLVAGSFVRLLSWLAIHGE